MNYCSVKGCKLSEKQHGRQYDHIEETVGRRAADEYADRHQAVTATGCRACDAADEPCEEHQAQMEAEVMEQGRLRLTGESHVVEGTVVAGGDLVGMKVQFWGWTDAELREAFGK